MRTCFYKCEIDMKVFEFEASIDDDDFNTVFSLSDEGKPDRKQIAFL